MKRIRRRGTRCARDLAVALPLALLLLQLTAGPARAHDLAIGQSEIVQDGDVVRYDLAVTYAELAKRVPGLTVGTSAADDADHQAALRASLTAVEGYVGAHLQVLHDRVPCDDTLDAVDTVRHRGVLFAVLELAYRCPGSVDGHGFYEVRYDLFFDERSAADHTAHASVVDYRLGGAEGRFVFEPATAQLQVGEPSPPPSAPPPVLLGATLGSVAVIALVLTLLARLRRRRIRPLHAPA